MLARLITPFVYAHHAFLFGQIISAHLLVATALFDQSISAQLLVATVLRCYGQKNVVSINGKCTWTG